MVKDFFSTEIKKAGRHLNIKLLLLFGSRATGRPAPSPDSDFDLAVLDNQKWSWKRYETIRGKLSTIFKDEILDIVSLNDADPLFRLEITSRCKLLYGEPLFFYEYKTFAYRDYWDKESILNLENVLMNKKLEKLRAKLYGSS
ncbi:MAG: nucleotidyltransferase domain-containing protein [Elusimicrobia bacterium]|nr:nucleotidyltransferase domain-containing protein [Elusimicrobiota bacterium]